MSWSPGSLPFDVMRSGSNLNRGQRAVLLACITAASPGDWTDAHRDAAAQAHDEPAAAGVVTASAAELGWLAQMSPKHTRIKVAELVELGLLHQVDQGPGAAPVLVIVDRAVKRLRLPYPGRKVRPPRTLRPTPNPGPNVAPPRTLRPTPSDLTSGGSKETQDATSHPPRTLGPTPLGPYVGGSSPITRVRGQDDQDDQTPDPSYGLEGKEPRDGLDADAGLPVSAGLPDAQPNLDEPSGRRFPAGSFAAALGLDDEAELESEPEPVAAPRATGGFGAALAQLTPATVSKPASRSPQVEAPPVTSQPDQAKHHQVAELRGPQLLSALKAAEAQLAHDGEAHGALVTALGRMAHDVEDLLRGPVDPVGLRQLVESHRPKLDAAVDEHNGGPLNGLPTRDRYAFADHYALRVWEVCTQITWALTQETTAA